MCCELGVGERERKREERSWIERKLEKKRKDQSKANAEGRGREERKGKGKDRENDGDRRESSGNTVGGRGEKEMPRAEAREGKGGERGVGDKGIKRDCDEE